MSNEVPIVDESDLSLKKLDDFQSQLQDLQKEKVNFELEFSGYRDMLLMFFVLTALFWQSDRLRKVLEFVSTVHDLCAVLGLDFLSTVTEVHPSLDEQTGVQSKSISNDTLSRLAKTVLTLKDDKKQRLQKVYTLFILTCLKLFL